MKKMKIGVIGDYFLPGARMAQGIRKALGEDVEIAEAQWEIRDRAQAQQQNLWIEENGPENFEYPAGVIEKIADVDILVTQFFPVGSILIDRCANLRTIGVLRGGVENVACGYATKKNIAVYNTPGRNATAVADFTAGLIIAEARGIARGDRSIRSGGWQDQESIAGAHDLAGKTLGLIGLGKIGQKVAARMNAFEMKVVAYDPYVSEAPDYIELLSMDEVFRRADYISLHTRLCAETQGLVSREKIALMKESAYLFNTARAGLVDEAALAEALLHKRIRGAGLDVFETEPLPDGHPFLSLPNVTLTPHMAGSTVESFTESPVLFACNLLNEWKGGPHWEPVNGKELAEGRPRSGKGVEDGA